MNWASNIFLVSVLIIYSSTLVTSDTPEDTLSPASFYPNYNFDAFKILTFKTFTTFQCNESFPQKYTVTWQKDNKEIEQNKRVRIDNNKLVVYASKQEDLANYSCEISTDGKVISRHEFIAIGHPVAKIHVDTNPVDEGGTIRLQCDVWGRPVSAIKWEKNNLDISPETDNRVQIDYKSNNGISNGILVIENAVLADRGEYTCIGETEYPTKLFPQKATSVVRVKDRFAALWPFIGICAEVIVLCTIIFIYERKRNKSELDESDTDQSPEQKNTPDHGKESVRQRK